MCSESVKKFPKNPMLGRRQLKDGKVSPIVRESLSLINVWSIAQLLKITYYYHNFDFFSSIVHNLRFSVWYDKRIILCRLNICLL